MSEIRCGDKIGINLNQVVAWSRSKTQWKEEVLSLYLSGAGTVCVSQNIVGSQAFANLHKLLLDRFAIDLSASDNSLEEVEYKSCDEEDGGIKLEDISY
jgi:hypothetical protein